MRASLEKLSRLPGDTSIFCAHEYTLANLRFACLVEPENTELRDFLATCEQKREQNEPTVPSTISVELSCNPFLRWGSPDIRKTLEATGRLVDDSPDGIFTAVREWKNTA
jgi:hydroxyacylglutathione hydrolase